MVAGLDAAQNFVVKFWRKNLLKVIIADFVVLFFRVYTANPQIGIIFYNLTPGCNTILFSFDITCNNNSKCNCNKQGSFQKIRFHFSSTRYINQ